MLTDIDSHHIEGRIDDEYLKIPLISHIQGNLWVGGCLPDVELPEDFRYIVSLYPWEKYAIPQWCSRIECRLYDAAKIPDEALLWGLASLTNELLNHGQTLVHCQAGLNRSNLIAALTLILRGYQPAEAIALLREKRSSAVLCNRTFEQWILTQNVTER